MYGHTMTDFSRASDSSFEQTPSAPDMQEVLPTGNSCASWNVGAYVPDHLELDSLGEILRVPSSDISNNSYDSGSGSSGYGSPTSLASYGGTALASYGGTAGSSTTVTTPTPTPHPRFCWLIQRCGSGYSLPKKSYSGLHHPFSRLFSKLIDSETGLVRRVYSSVHRMDLMPRSPPSSQSTMIILEGMSRASRYSAEEKKERIERYRSKRNLRNFNKKIKYACRKNLADSRPRVRGRFARNGESDQKDPPAVWRHGDGEDEEEEEGDDWMNLLDTFSANFIQ